MQLEHVVITRFSYRVNWAGWNDHDPLEPTRLERRLRLFEIAPLPSILAQTCQDFSWVLIVDRALGAAERARLDRLVGARSRTYIHTFDPDEHINGTDWLTPYLASSNADYLVTTNLDDDDALPNEYIAELQAALQRLAEAGPPILFAGATETVEWDLLHSRAMPLGSASRWDRPLNAESRVSACGFTLAARQPDYPFSVLGMRHTLAKHHLDFDTPPAQPPIERIRRQFNEAAARAGDDLEAYPATATFFDTSSVLGPVLMTNHLGNLQASRVLEAKSGTPVTGAQSFEGFTLGWEALARYADSFRLTPRIRLDRAWWRLRGRLRHSRLGRRLRPIDGPG